MEEHKKEEKFSSTGCEDEMKPMNFKITVQEGRSTNVYIYEHMLVSLTLIEPLISQFYINLCVCYRTHNSTSS